MPSIRVSLQLLVSVLFIAVPANSEKFKIFLYLLMYFFYLCNCIGTRAQKNHAVLICTGKIIAYCSYDMEAGLYKV